MRGRGEGPQLGRLSHPEPTPLRNRRDTSSRHPRSQRGGYRQGWGLRDAPTHCPAAARRGRGVQGPSLHLLPGPPLAKHSREPYGRHQPIWHRATPPRPHWLYLSAGGRSRCGNRAPGSHTAPSGGPCSSAKMLAPRWHESLLLSLPRPRRGRGVGLPQCQKKTWERGVPRGRRPPWGLGAAVTTSRDAPSTHSRGLFTPPFCSARTRLLKEVVPDPALGDYSLNGGAPQPWLCALPGNVPRHRHEVPRGDCPRPGPASRPRAHSRPAPRATLQGAGVSLRAASRHQHCCVPGRRNRTPLAAKCSCQNKSL